MRWEISYSAAVLAGIFSGTCAFAPVVSRPRISSLGVGQGWDNEDFLGALGKGSDEIDAANEQYRAQSRYEPGEQAADEVGEGDSAIGAELTPDMVEKIKASHDEDEERYGGGSMFKNLMERAQSGQMLRPNTPPPPPPPPPAASSAAPPVSLENMSVEEQARMFREMMQQQQQQQQPVAPPPVASTPPPVVQKALQPFPQAYPPQGVPLAPDGRKVGRNRDADAIVNSADVYFAQLKTDSTSRTLARIRGDDETANKVWHDPRIKEIEVYVNPYLEEAKKKEQQMLETSADELLIPILEKEDRVLDKSYTGVRYKDRLRNRGKKSSSAPAPAAPVAATPVAAPPAPAPVESSTPVAPPAPVTTNPVAVAATPPAPVAPAPVPPPAVAAPVPSPPQPVATGDLRKDIRTTQGLLIKHRGGPGFGSGRLRGNDIQKFEGLAKEVTASLRQEATGAAAQAPPPPAVSAPATAPLAPPAAAAAAVVDPRAASMIACVNGAVLLYKNSPPELQESVLVTLRAALVSAVNTCNDLLADNDTIPASAATSSSVPAMIACLEGAVQLYEHSPPELQASVLVTLRAALLAAVSTCNIAIAENEVQNVQDYQAATGAGPAAMPTDFHDVAVPEKAPAEVEPAQSAPTNVAEALSVDDPNAKILERVYQKLENEDAAGAQASVSEALSGDDSNSQILERVYQKLQNAAGDGKMGLRSDLPPSDAQALADDLVEMRSLMVDELQNGVPAAAPVAASASSPSGSLYKKLLAKARADKEKGQ